MMGKRVTPKQPYARQMYGIGPWVAKVIWSEQVLEVKSQIVGYYKSEQEALTAAQATIAKDSTNAD